MPWFKIDDGFHGHPKVVDLSLSAVGLWTMAGTWSSHYLTDGVVTEKTVFRLGGTKTQAEELVDAGLWLQLDDGYEFKDWEDYQPMRATVLAERKAARDRMAVVRSKRKGSSPEQVPERSEDVQVNNTGTDGRTSGEVLSAPSLPIPSLSHPLPIPSDGRRRRSPETPLPEAWKPNDLHRVKAQEKHLDVTVLAEAFRNHAEQNDRRARNWDAAFRNWILNAKPGDPKVTLWNPGTERKPLDESVLDQLFNQQEN